MLDTERWNLLIYTMCGSMRLFCWSPRQRIGMSNLLQTSSRITRTYSAETYPCSNQKQLFSFQVASAVAATATLHAPDVKHHNEPNEAQAEN